MENQSQSLARIEAGQGHGSRRLVWLAFRFHGPATAAKIERLLRSLMSPEAVRGTIVALRRERKIQFARKLGKTPRGRWARMWEVVP